ncbi:hypothetical protein ABH941_001891 [Streptacidiphilus sp. EB103A]
MSSGMAHQHALRRSGPEARNGTWISDRDAGTTQLLRDESGVLSSLRVLDVGLAADPGFQGAYPAETSALAALDDPRVAPPERYVVGATGRIIAVVRRHIDGVPLSTLLTQRSRGFDWQTASVVVTDVLAALSALHGRGVPHRSVHPNQVLVGTDGVCVLVDVGLVRRTGSPDGSSPEAGPATEQRETAIAADLAAVAILFAACVFPAGKAGQSAPAGPSVLGGQTGRRARTSAGTAALDGVPDLLRAVLDRANDPDAREGRTAADLLTAFGKVTSRAFDAGWVERGRERLIAQVEDNRQAPPGLTEMVRAGWSRRRGPGRRVGAGDGSAQRGPSGRATGAVRAMSAQVAAYLPTQNGAVAEESGERSQQSGWRARLRSRRGLWQVGILLVMVAGVIAATLTGVHSKGGTRSAPSSVAGGAAARPSAIGTAFAAPVPGRSRTSGPSPSMGAGAGAGAGAGLGRSATPSASATTPPGAWQEVGYTKGTMTQDAAVSHSGDGSLKLTAAAGGYVFAGLASRMAVQPGSHTYAAWIRTEGPSQQKVCIDLLFYDSAGRQIGSDHAVFSNGGSHDWQQVSITLARPSGAAQADLQLRLGDQGLSQGGSAWFDGVTVSGS